MKVDLPAPFGPVSPYRRPAENVLHRHYPKLLDMAKAVDKGMTVSEITLLEKTKE